MFYRVSYTFACAWILLERLRRVAVDAMPFIVRYVVLLVCCGKSRVVKAISSDSGTVISTSESRFTFHLKVQHLNEIFRWTTLNESSGLSHCCQQGYMES